MKTSLAPGSKVVTEYLAQAGLLTYLEQLRFNLVGYGCTTCIGNSGPLPDAVSKAIADDDLVVAAVLSGNRNFEGRVHPEVRANYLASPPLVVAYALAGTMDIDLTTEPLGTGKDGKPVFLKDIWPTREEVEAVVEKSHQAATMFRRVYADVFKGDEQWAKLAGARRGSLRLGREVHLREAPAVLRGHDRGAGAGPADINGARVLALLGDSITTDHISPAGSIKKDGPAGKYLVGARRRAEGLQLVRRAPRQPRGDGARHVRQRPPARTCSRPAPKAASRATSRRARR